MFKFLKNSMNNKGSDLVVDVFGGQKNVFGNFLELSQPLLATQEDIKITLLTMKFVLGGLDMQRSLEWYGIKKK